MIASVRAVITAMDAVVVIMAAVSAGVTDSVSVCQIARCLAAV